MNEVHVKHLRHENSESPGDGMEETLSELIGEELVGRYELEPRMDQNLGMPKAETDQKNEIKTEK
jgi:hypothetical protein